MEYKQIVKDDKTLMYKIKYNDNTKNISAKVDKNNEIIVTCPKFLTLEQIDIFINKYFDRFYEFISKRKQRSLVDWSSNKMSIKGKSYNIIIQKISTGREKYEIINDKIYLFLKDEDNKKKLINKMLTKLGQSYLLQRCDELATRFKVLDCQFATKWYESKWGQCENLKRKITIAIQLYMFTDKIIDYVIIHELCHLFIANHSPEFWALVKKICPDYKIIKEKLKFEC